jgi:hypothetical protein
VNKHTRGVTRIATVLVTVLLPITAWSVDEDIVQKQEVEARLLIRALGGYGPEARVSAILLACGKDGLANSVLPAQFDVAIYASRANKARGWVECSERCVHTGAVK